LIRVNDKIRIREFRYPADYKEVYHLWATAGEGIHLRRSDETEEIEKKIQRDPDLFLVAENEGEIIGSVMGGFDGRRGLVYHLAVAEPYREQGIGSLLMTDLEQRLRAKGCLRCYLLVTPDNQNTIRFYENREWEKMDLFVYGKDLS
jgi:ribosomal protein S18 acetylase RimI-like enzyme